MRRIHIPGLDLMLGGALVVVPRAGAGKENTTILVRGGPGVGKTVFATHLATKLAEHWKADVAYACVELLPTELAAQYAGIHPEIPPANVHVAPWAKERGEAARPRIFASMLDLGERLDPKKTRERFEREVVALYEAACKVSGRIRVLVVDSLSDGYGLGGEQAPRWLADTLCKFAAEKGLSLVLIEETTRSTPSVWSFAVDLVLEIASEPMASGCRAMRVSKNRFGPTIGGDAELHVGPGGITLMPPLAAYFDDRNPMPEIEPARELKWGFAALDGLEKLTRFDAPVTALVDYSVDVDVVHRLGGEADSQAVDIEINYLGSTRPKARKSPRGFVFAHGGPFVTKASVLHPLLALLRKLHASERRVRKIVHRVPGDWLPALSKSDVRVIEHALAHLARGARIPLVAWADINHALPMYRVQVRELGSGTHVWDHDSEIDLDVALAAPASPAR